LLELNGGVDAVDTGNEIGESDPQN